MSKTSRPVTFSLFLFSRLRGAPVNMRNKIRPFFKYLLRLIILTQPVLLTLSSNFTIAIIIESTFYHSHSILSSIVTRLVLYPNTPSLRIYRHTISNSFPDIVINFQFLRRQEYSTTEKAETIRSVKQNVEKNFPN